MQVCPFTGELYHGEILDGICDGCSKPCTYEEDAYGQNFIIFCDECENDDSIPYRPSRSKRVKYAIHNLRVKFQNLRFSIETYLEKIGLIDDDLPF